MYKTGIVKLKQVKDFKLKQQGKEICHKKPSFLTRHRQSLHNHDYHAKEVTKEAFSYFLAMISNSHESHLHSGVFVRNALSFNKGTCIIKHRRS